MQDLAIPLARNNLLGLVRNLVLNAINKSERKISAKKPWEQEKDFLYLFRMKIQMILLKSYKH